MKIRSSFVSNSSSSSFICDVCGYTTETEPYVYYAEGMMVCENGHKFCEHHMVNRELWIKMKSFYRCDEKEPVMEEFCPICSKVRVIYNDEQDIVSYLL